jgi:hypothetical protein
VTVLDGRLRISAGHLGRSCLLVVRAGSSFGGRVVAFVRGAKAPELPVILLEDLGALLGLTFVLAVEMESLLVGRVLRGSPSARSRSRCLVRGSTRSSTCGPCTSARRSCSSPRRSRSLRRRLRRMSPRRSTPPSGGCARRYPIAKVIYLEPELRRPQASSLSP